MPTPPVCDYEGSDYRTRFWENQGRDYEDQVERIALRRLMPAAGETLLDVGAGFGRLANEYFGYQKVVLFDYSRSLLREAQAHWGNDPRFIYVAGDWYKMPFVNSLFDTLVQVRTIHHAADVPALFQQLARIAKPNGRYVLEFANKRNLKAIGRYWLGRQTWSPFTPEPIEFVELNFDFQPEWILQQLEQAGFAPHAAAMLTASHFRLAPLKKLVSTPWLAQLDKIFQPTGRWFQLTPSVFVPSDAPASGTAAAANTFFACPEDQIPLPEPADDLLTCPACGRQYRVDAGLYDFKSPA